ncbi:40-residue YVTN family beta-propeller repeat-containing protein [Singulisphaera sp. GP187]|uniref:YncE family protein n=1 Tax=Singulisphaera sp. GP187 TaxID=1882752 RepID=UPI0009258FC9|nr:YncE family protein [Singulisphaera sp. GP187]SIN80850.1 40-residue YVTN family beta-propeller repeat-containing protein [Singulisphaera sp. GP187]
MKAALVFALLGAAGTAVAQEPPSPLLLVVNKFDSNLAIVDPASHRILGKVAVGHIPHEVAASADGKFAYVTNYGTDENPSHSLSVIDVTAKKEIHRVELSPLFRPHGIAVASGKVYFTAESNKVIGRYDPASNRVDWVQGTGQDQTHMVALSRDDKTLFTTNILSDTISIWQRSESRGGWKQDVIHVGAGPEGFDLSPDGKQLWAANSRDGHVAIVDLATKKLEQTFDVGTKRSNRLKFTPDGKTALVSDMGTGELIVVDVSSRTVTKRLPLGQAAEGILLPPDGRHAYVALTDDNAIAIVDLKSYSVVGRIETGKGPDGMAWLEGN